MPDIDNGFSHLAMSNPVSFRYFKTSPEIIQLVVMLYVRFPLSLRNVEGLLNERGVDVSYESVRYWWHRFGSQFASQSKKRRAGSMQAMHWKWHLDEVFVKINGPFVDCKVNYLTLFLTLTLPFPHRIRQQQRYRVIGSSYELNGNP